MSEPTEAWMSFDPAFTIGPNHEEYTWHVPVSGNGALVYHKVFPLSVTTGIEPRGPAYESLDVTAAMTASSPGSSYTGPADKVLVTSAHRRTPDYGYQLSTGAIIGIMIVAVAMTGIGIWLFLQCLSERRNEADGTAAAENDHTDDIIHVEIERAEQKSNL
jgi:hypothetical protein